MNVGLSQPDPRDAIIAELQARNAQLQSHIVQLEARIAKLEVLLAAATRSSKRQAAPFSKGTPKADPKTPGRKAGDGYGTKARRAVPPIIDEVHEAPVTADACPECGGTLQADGVVEQYQTEIPRRPIYRQFNIHVARCACCATRVQGRHPLQTSDAIGAAASQLGPDAQAAIVHLNKVGGLSQGKIATVFTELFGIRLTRGGACQAMLRAARRCQPAYDEIVRGISRAPWLVPDETGWRVGGTPAWLHACVTPDAVAYLIDRRRGFDGSSKLIPRDYAGKMVHDGYKPYQRYHRALHQTCINHMLRRSREILEKATGGAVIFPRKVTAILKESLAVRDARDADKISLEQATARADTLRLQIRGLTERPKTNAENDRFGRHLYANQHNLFLFLKHPELDATNHKAEQAIRPAVVNRKVWGGNRTPTGAQAQSILMTALGTAKMRGVAVIGWMSGVLKNTAKTLSIAPPEPQTG